MATENASPPADAGGVINLMTTTLSLVERNQSSGKLRSKRIAGLVVDAPHDAVPPLKALVIRPPPDDYSRDFSRIRSLPTVPVRCAGDSSEEELWRFLEHLRQRGKAACVRGFA